MKILLLLWIPTVATAFALSPSKQQRCSTTLNVGLSHWQDGGSNDDWSDKPIPKYESTATRSSLGPVPAVQRWMKEDVMIDPSYTLTMAVAALGPLIMWYHPSYALDGSPSMIGIMGGCFHLLFAALLWVQTRRVRCVFERDAFEFYNIKGHKLDLDKGARLETKPSNYVTGSSNRWRYDSIIHYGFFPSERFPVICYFKETDTPEEQWNRWFAAFDSYGRGQPHFFPGICDVAQFKHEMESRGVKRKEIPTFKKLASPK
mmetsp:Transcript_24234/g.67534  ORF Transcript_24234/g.67534 Transcript_24234/m.67534 type:complete len:260 (-) Transcript_24234:259-1038(-)|eukprot:CAMPEP_0198115780 /NCGR_PEP_ID=MMETSP1442-20131203/7216_1 /TAXON_ID= /ORGANISM="Craspedostauros australis, Strain CCMP3328" /LENGTH=259 /DNA_ID=CAMNT_0043773355 /DNA_START=101 /DNA_END=880 /DNA_ORIENTATION=-